MLTQLGARRDRLQENNMRGVSSVEECFAGNDRLGILSPWLHQNEHIRHADSGVFLRFVKY